jgi:hypothetical protein
VTNLRRFRRTARDRRHRALAREHHPQRDRSRLSIERPSPKVEGCRSRRTRLSIPVSYGWLPKGQLLRAVSPVHVQRGHQDAHLQGGGSAPAAADQNSDLLTPPGRYFHPETHPSASFGRAMAQGDTPPCCPFCLPTLAIPISYRFCLHSLHLLVISRFAGYFQYSADLKLGFFSLKVPKIFDIAHTYVV